VPEGSAPESATDGRVSTGCAGLDAMLQGGLVAHRPYLVVGPSGTGKSTLALQFLCEGVRHGERVLLVTLEEPPNEVRVNHRGFGPALDEVEVFDAIPDIMRYERTPFKDIASVRHAAPFREVPLEIRRSPELSAVEVTMTALEQMLRSEVVRRNYTRLVIDSLTALQFFCMKGFDPVAGAQAFLRFLSDLRVTTILTVESPLEDADTPERMLARGEVRLFRWELDGRTVRAIGVEKFRGSSHDVRLHPYRLGPKGVDVNLDVTISRDTRHIIESPRPVELVPAAPTPIPVEEVISPVDPLAEEVRDLVLVGAELAPVRTEIEAALGAAATGDLERSRGHLSRANSLVIATSDALRERMKEVRPAEPEIAEAYQRIVGRSEAARAGVPPTRLPPPKVLEVQLEWVLSLIPAGPVRVTEAQPEAVTGPVVAPVAAGVSLAPALAPPAELPGPAAAQVEARNAPAPATVEPSPPATTEVVAPRRVEPVAPPKAEPATLSASSEREKQLPPPPSPPPTPPPARELSPPPTPPTKPLISPAPSHRVATAPPLAASAVATIVGAGKAAATAPASMKVDARPPLPHLPAELQPTVHKAAAAVPPPKPPSRAPPPTKVVAPPSPPPTAPPSPEPFVAVAPVGATGAGAPSEPSSPAPEAAAPAAPRRKRKASTTSRKKAAAPAPPAAGAPEGPAATPSPVATPPVPGSSSPPPASGTPAVEEVAAPTRPKRRPARKRKAPPVVAARPGPTPPDAAVATEPVPAPEPAAPPAEPPREGT
jgi:KaiC/GvpD/RAD55 family RecA-like ATPase